MALLSIIVRQAQYSGDRSVTSQYCTYVTLTLDRCRTTTVTVKGHNPHWEQDYLFETQNTSRGLLIEVWKQDDYLHTPIGCYWLPLNMVRYSNEHTTGLWASLGSELFIENGLIVKSVNSTGHFLLYDARLEDPDDRRVEHANVDNENVEDYYQSTTSRRVNESSSNKVAPPALPAEPNGEWYRYENYQDGYRSSSSENVRSDLDYSYSETSNHIDRRSCYESSEKSLEKEQYSHEERNEQSYYSEYDQSENYKSTNSFSKRSNYENQVDGDEQWVSDEYADEQGDEIYQNSHHDYGPSDGEYNFSYKSSHFKRTENNSKVRSSSR